MNMIRVNITARVIVNTMVWQRARVRIKFRSGVITYESRSKTHTFLKRLVSYEVNSKQLYKYIYITVINNNNQKQT